MRLAGQYRRHRNLLQAYRALSVVLVAATVFGIGFSAGFAVVALYLALYVIWMLFKCRRLQRTEVRLTVREAWIEQANANSTVTLWVLEVLAIVFIGIGYLIFITGPDFRIAGILTIVFFVFLSVVIPLMLITKRREKRAQSTS